MCLLVEFCGAIRTEKMRVWAFSHAVVRESEFSHIKFGVCGRQEIWCCSEGIGTSTLS